MHPCNILPLTTDAKERRFNQRLCCASLQRSNWRKDGWIFVSISDFAVHPCNEKLRSGMLFFARFQSATLLCIPATLDACWAGGMLAFQSATLLCIPATLPILYQIALRRFQLATLLCIPATTIRLRSQETRFQLATLLCIPATQSSNLLARQTEFQLATLLCIPATQVFAIVALLSFQLATLLCIPATRYYSYFKELFFKNQS